MIQESHLQVYDLTLTTRSPLFIGSGISYKKHEYCFNPQNSKVSFLDQQRFFQMLIQHQLLDAYETFIFSNNQNLHGFLRQTCHLSSDEIKKITRYTVSAADSLDDRHSLKEVHAFQRSSEGKAYIPGSSVKGAMRTVFLTELMRREKKGGPTLPDASKDRKGYEMAKLEGLYLNTLHLSTKNGAVRNDPVNSIFRGISISDSLPISDEEMILCGKFDISPSGNVKKLNLCRECVRPGTTLRFKLTLDQSILKGSVTPETIFASISDFSSFYCSTYLSKFELPSNAISCSYQNALILGGGAGFFAKTITYPYLCDGALQDTAAFMSSQFRNHKHHLDTFNYGISPHTLKYAQCGVHLYPYGVCEVTIR